MRCFVQIPGATQSMRAVPTDLVQCNVQLHEAVHKIMPKSVLYGNTLQWPMTSGRHVYDAGLSHARIIKFNDEYRRTRHHDATAACPINASFIHDDTDKMFVCFIYVASNRFCAGLLVP